jgi:hypothetical protein
MKYLWKILAVACITITMIPVTALAEASDIDINYYEEETEIDIHSTEEYKRNKAINIYDSESSNTNKLEKLNDVNEVFKNEGQSKRHVKFRGIWGLSGDNESDGYFAGKIYFGHKIRILKGFYNKTENETKGRIVGFLKNGYFNGKIITPDGTRSPIIGLFKVDQENKALKMKWMTPHCNGWAAARLFFKA